MIEFGVLRVHEEPEYALIGRLHEGTVRLGSVFTQALYADGSSKAIEVRVVGLDMYRRSFSELSAGMVAKLTVLGEVPEPGDGSIVVIRGES